MTNVNHSLIRQKGFPYWIMVLFFLLNIAVYSKADNLISYKISGTIQSLHSGQPIAFASVVLYQKNDSVLVTGTISNDEGRFEIETREDGYYFLEIRIVGFANQYVDQININESNPHIDLGIITINEQSIELDEVVITEERSAIEYKIDRQVLDVSKLGVPPSAPLSEALQVLPSIETDMQGNVRLRGSGNFQVLIDGKPSALTGSEALQQYSAAQIEKIEIITNPSAKYEADNTSGIINLILKKGEGMGLSGMVNYGISRGAGEFSPYNFSSTLNYRRKKYAITGVFNFSDQRYDYELTINQKRSEQIDVNRFNTNHVPWHRNRVSLDLDYFVNDRHTLTLGGRIMQNDNGFDIQAHNYLSGPGTEPFFSQVKGVSDRHTMAVSLHDRLKFEGEGHELTILGTFFNQSLPELQTFLQYPTLEAEDADFHRIWNTYIDHNEFQFRTDYTKPIGANGALEVGTNFLVVSRNSLRETETFFPAPAPLSVDQYGVTNETYAGYGTYKNKLADIDYQVGARIEHYSRTIEHEDSEAAYDYQILNVFPSLHLAKKINDKQEVRLSYTGRTQRPSMMELQPYYNWSDNYSSYIGNPELIPAYIHSIEMSYSRWFEHVSTTVGSYYRNTSNGITTGAKLNSESGVIDAIPINIDHSTFYGIESSLDITAAQWLKIIASGTYFHNIISGELFETKINQNYNGWRARLNNRINFPKSINLNINGFYNSEVFDLQGQRGSQYWVDIALSTSFLNKQGTFALSFSDVFATNRLNQMREGDDFSNYSSVRFPRQVIGIDISYRFNSFKNKAVRFEFED